MEFDDADRGGYDPYESRPSTNTEGRYFKLYVTTMKGSGKKAEPVYSELIWFTAKSAAELAFNRLLAGGYRVTRLYRT